MENKIDNKKPWYQKWWVIVLIVLFFIWIVLPVCRVLLLG